MNVMMICTRSLTVPTIAVVAALLAVACRDEETAGPTSPATLELSGLPATLGPPSTSTATPPATPPATEATPATDGPPVRSTTTAPDATSFVEEIEERVGDDGSFRPESARFATVTDDTGRVSVRVPAVWTDRATSPGRLEDGSDAPYVAASPDLTAFLDGYDTAGMTLVVLPPASRAAAALEDYRFAADCAGGRAQSFAAEGLAGEFHVWTDCGDTTNDIVTLAAMPDDESFTVAMLVQILTDFDVAALEEALTGLEVRPPRAATRRTTTERPDPEPTIGDN